MIDESTFRDAWAILKERFDRDLSDLQMDLYYRTIAERLDTDEFKRGVRRVYYECRWFPTPKEIVDAGLDRDADREAELEWERVIGRRDDMNAGDSTPPDEMPSAGALRALKTLGGMAALRNASPGEIRRFRRAFLDAYESFRPREPAPSLPGKDAPRALSTGDDDDG